MDIKERIKKVPNAPGVYLFLDKNKEVIYVGKASNLRKRTSSYFQKRYQTPKTRALVSNIKDLDYITTSSSVEALIYEANLIKEKRPKYNIELKDDKSYPFLKLTIGEKFPRLFITRGKENDKAIYYGPYTNAQLLKKALAIVRSIFLIRPCKRLPKNVCLKFHINQCVGPCSGKIKEREYRKIVNEVKLFLGGKKENLLKDLSRRMKKAAEKFDYETALRLRDKIDSLSALWKGRKAPPPLDKETSDLKDLLSLKVMPYRIEAFDISNIYGKEAVGSMVSFFSGKPQKDEYRRFRIKKVHKIDDYAMIREIIKRRYYRLIKENEKFPDLVVIDGGMGHLNAAKKELDKIMPDVPVISIAKKNEYIFTKTAKKPIIVTKKRPSLKLIMRIRDEAHRFAISYHKLLRGKALLHSVLEEIEGIGKSRKKILIEYFGSIGDVKKASLEELKKVKGITSAAAEKVYKHFKR